jgi:YesN/AraC family two-component response regulator
MYYSRQILRKNRELVRKAQQWANVAPAPAITDADGETETGEQLPKTAEPSETDRLLFAEIKQMIDKGLYKESNLSLEMLAGKTNQNPTYISKAVSHCTGKTFKTWLNEYRIKEAIRLLSDENNPTISIEMVAWDSGFNDRKTFHRIFRNTTGLSPTDFKKNRLHK